MLSGNDGEHFLSIRVWGKRDYFCAECYVKPKGMSGVSCQGQAGVLCSVS